MSDQNSVIEHQIRPEQLQDELGIKKDAYYAYMKHLGLKAGKDSEGKAYLEPEQANLVRALREHVVAGGKIEDFAISNSNALSVVEGNQLAADLAEEMPTPDPATGFDMDLLMKEAANLAGHRMTLANQVVLQLASQMTYDDLPQDVKAKVDSVREAVVPTVQPGKIAADLLSQWRQRQQHTQSQAQAA
jgi:hypothetical protein